MPIVEQEATIPSAAGPIFAALTDFGGAKTWLSGVTDSHQVTPSPVAVGTRFEQTRVTMGRPGKVEGTVTKLDAPRVLGLDVKRDGKPAGIVTWTVTPQGSGSSVKCRIDFQLPGLMKLMTPMVKRVIAKQTAGDLESLRAKVEGAK